MASTSRREILGAMVTTLPRVAQELSRVCSRFEPKAQVTLCYKALGAGRDHVVAAFRHAGELLSRVQEVLRVEEALDLLVQVERARAPLARELAALQDAEAVFPADRAAELYGQVEEILDREQRSLELLGLLGIDEERRVEVAVAGVAEREADQV